MCNYFEFGPVVQMSFQVLLYLALVVILFNGEEALMVY